MLKSMKASHYGLFAIAVLPGMIPLFLIAYFGSSTPFWDEWDPDMAGFYVKAYQHRLAWSDLVAQHYEHRLVVSRLVWLPVHFLTSGNMIAIMLIGWLASCVTSAGLWWLIGQSTSNDEPGGRRNLVSSRTLWLWLLCNCVLFTPMQWQNWIWGIGSANLMPAMFAVLAVAAGSSGISIRRKTLLLPTLCVLATYSSGNGILVWFITAITIGWCDSTAEFRAKRWLFGALAGAFVVAIGLYFIGYVAPDHSAEEAMAPRSSILTRLQFFVAFLGNAFVGSAPYSTLTTGTAAGFVVGTLLALSLLYALALRFIRRDAAAFRRLLPWLAVASYGLLTALLATLTRGKFGAMQAVTPRYISFGLFAPLALVPIISPAARDIRGWSAITNRLPQLKQWAIQLPALPCLIILLLPMLSWNEVLDGARSFRALRNQARGTLLLMQILPNNPHIPIFVTPKPQGVLENALALSRMGYLHPPLISNANARTIAASESSRFRAEGQLERGWKISEAQIAMRGWAAVTSRKNERADAVFLTYDDPANNPIIFATARADEPRNDLAAKYSLSHRDAGWIATFSNDELPQSVQSTVIRAWALDASTGQAIPISGMISWHR